MDRFFSGRQQRYCSLPAVLRYHTGSSNQGSNAVATVSCTSNGKQKERSEIVERASFNTVSQPAGFCSAGSGVRCGAIEGCHCSVIAFREFTSLCVLYAGIPSYGTTVTKSTVRYTAVFKSINASDRGSTVSGKSVWALCGQRRPTQTRTGATDSS